MQLTQCLDPASAVGWLPGELPGQSIHEHMTEETGAPRRRKDQRLNSGVPQTPPAGKAIAIRRPNARVLRAGSPQQLLSPFLQGAPRR